jgi:LCP family protein required for cell wall assembly
MDSDNNKNYENENDDINNENDQSISDDDAQLMNVQADISDSEEKNNQSDIRPVEEMPEVEYEVSDDEFDTYKKKSIIQRRWFKVLISIIVLLGIAGVVGFGYVNKLANSGSNSLVREKDKFLNKVNVYKGLNVAENFDGNTINILIFGIDRSEGREESGKYGSIYRPDTIVLASINLETEEVDLISIPRDTYVPLYGNRGRTKINACMYYGAIYGDKDTDFENGLECLEQTVSALLGGVPIDFYVGVDMDTVVDVVNSMGGVEFDIPYNLYKDGKLKLEKGNQVLNGKNFLFLARDRKNAGSDIERVAMQQKLLKALFEQFKESNKLMSIPTIYQSLKEDIYTNFTFEQVVSLAANVKDLDVDNINTHTFPGFYGSRDGISMWIINQSKRVSLIKDVFGISASQWTQEELRIDNRRTTTNNDTEDTTDEEDIIIEDDTSTDDTSTSDDTPADDTPADDTPSDDTPEEDDTSTTP